MRRQGPDARHAGRSCSLGHAIRAIEEVPFEFDVEDSLSWYVRASSYRKRKDFASDPEVNPLWNLGTALFTRETGASGTSASPLAARVLTIKIDTRSLGIAIAG
jgi:hypothetical protein